ncbi:UNVERIFIED_CONTAM: Autophagy-related protein 18g [Sesamum radiatum]|uniref:Autophagy-related protein 18g n=1 Tax=Sesamum radiatum TaxID=300843 RepID=A0AAW2UP29_SESRA
MRKGKGRNSKLLPNSLRIISSCIKTVSTSASTVVRSAGASVASSISSIGDEGKEQVLWAGFDKLETSPTAFRRVLLLGYLKGFQVFDVEDAFGFSELVSRRNGPVTFLQMLPAASNCDGAEKDKSSHNILVVVGGKEDAKIHILQTTGQVPIRHASAESSSGSSFDQPTAVRFYSMKSNDYVKVMDFRSPVLMVRCSPRVVAIGLEEQVYCFDTLTLEQKFTVLTYPVPLAGKQGAVGVNSGYGPLAVGPRWLAYPPNRPFLLSTGRVSPKNLAISVSPSTSSGNGSPMARYAVESSKQLASSILTLGDMGYKKLSKYYPELLPDDPGSPGFKTGKLAEFEPENAGLVCVKDVVSSEVISQFRAHTSAIAALCFDPSGTLLVTASVHGNNINIFRIMPSRTCSGAGCSDWSTSYVYLYKIYRGITPAVIQDICFSHDSRWIAVVSSKGTCHIFVLSPFGGDDAFQDLQTCERGTSLFLASAPPWWSSSSFTIHERTSSPPPPPPCTLSIVSRIKYSDSGLVGSMSNVAASMAGKIWVPSGAIAAIFHNSNCTNSPNVNMRAVPLESILVYAPSGFVVQHEIHSSVLPELSENRTDSWLVPQVSSQNEELRVKVKPTKWWDASRRSENLEREESISGTSCDRRKNPEIDGASKMVFQDNVSTMDKKLIGSNSLKSPERSDWYLSNAEVQTNSYRLPLWQMSMVHFHAMEHPIAECYSDGEFEVEIVCSHEVEIRNKDLLPIFDHYSRARSGWIDGYIPSEGRYPSDSCQARDEKNEASIICHSKPPSFSSTESSDGGTEKTVDIGLLFKEGYYNRTEVRDYCRSTEVFTDKVDTAGNTHQEKPKEEGLIGAVFDL